MSLRCDLWPTYNTTEIYLNAVVPHPDLCRRSYNWTTNLALAKTLVNVRGGPEILLSRSAADEPGFGMSNGVFRAKVMLETLAVYDIFGRCAWEGLGRVSPFPQDAQKSLFSRTRG